MKLSDIVDRLAGHHHPPQAAPSRNTDDQQASAVSRVERMERDIRNLDNAVALAEARLRARGLQVPDDDNESTALG